MAGHSKFKNIMYRKGAQDKKRSAMFSKLAREITVAAKMGLPDPDVNARLRAAVTAASAQSMPKDNIQRSIDKAAGGDAENYEELRYEGFGPGGVALIVEALTDNRNRTATNVRTALLEEWRQSRRLGLGQPRLRAARPDRLSGLGRRSPTKCSRRRSRPAPRTSNRTRTATRSGPRIDDLHGVARALEDALGEAESVKLAWRPPTSVEVGGDDAGQLVKLIDTLEEDDDVQTVWGNYEVLRRGDGAALNSLPEPVPAGHYAPVTLLPPPP